MTFYILNINRKKGSQKTSIIYSYFISRINNLYYLVKG